MTFQRHSAVIIPGAGVVAGDGAYSVYADQGGRGSHWNRMFRVVLFFLLAILIGHVSAESGLRSFLPGSLAAIKQAREGRPFILVFWSADCVSCVKELDALSQSLAKHPDLNVVMIATDEPSFEDAVEAVLDRYGLTRVENWIFGDPDAQRLRREVDSSWLGELPRSYFYDTAHRRRAHSGALSVQQIEDWLAAAKP